MFLMVLPARVSPDGTWLAYWVGWGGGGYVMAKERPKIFVLRLTEENARVQPDLHQPATGMVVRRWKLLFAGTAPYSGDNTQPTVSMRAIGSNSARRRSAQGELPARFSLCGRSASSRPLGAVQFDQVRGDGRCDFCRPDQRASTTSGKSHSIRTRRSHWPANANTFRHCGTIGPVLGTVGTNGMRFLRVRKLGGGVAQKKNMDIFWALPLRKIDL